MQNDKIAVPASQDREIEISSDVARHTETRSAISRATTKRRLMLALEKFALYCVALLAFFVGSNILNLPELHLPNPELTGIVIAATAGFAIGGLLILRAFDSLSRANETEQKLESDIRLLNSNIGYAFEELETARAELMSASKSGRVRPRV